MDLNIKAADTGIAHLSFSAVRDFLRNPRNFRKRWIDLDFNRTPQLPLIEGAAFHAALETYWGMIYAGIHLNTKRGIVIDRDEIVHNAKMRAEMEYPSGAEKIRKRIAKKDVEQYKADGCEIEEEVRESATGRKSTITYAIVTPESITRGIEQNIDKYLEQRTEADFTPWAIEHMHVALTTDAETGMQNPFPLKVRVDLIAKLPDGRMAFVDHKYNGDDPEEDEDGNLKATPQMILQAAAYESVSKDLLAGLHIEGEITTVVFDIFNKKTGKMSQVIVEIGERERRIWSRIYRGVQTAILIAYAMDDYEAMFLPNPDDWTLDGWAEFEKDIEYTMENNGENRKIAPPTETYEPLDL